VRRSRRDVQASYPALPVVRFEKDRHALTSYAGLFVFQILFRRLDVKQRLARCFAHLGHAAARAYSLQAVSLTLVLHLLLGHRRLRHLDYYRDDEMVRRTLGLRHLPHVSTVTRSLRAVDERSVDNVRRTARDLVLDGLARETLPRVTLDFDGSVLSTCSRTTQGTAIGFNKAKKGARSYYPLFATVAQTGQVLDVLHRPGNVHDSNGAKDFALELLDVVKNRLPRAAREARLDSAHFSEEMVEALAGAGIDFTISVPFERLPALKAMVEQRRRWKRINGTWSCFEANWAPASWNRKHRFLFFRQKKKVPLKGPLQLDLFEPRSHEYEYKVVLAHRAGTPKAVLAFHNGRGAQEGVLGELKSHTQLDYVPTRSLLANRHFLLCSVLAHNLNRELQMRTQTPTRRATATRAALWTFRKAGTLIRTLVQRAGRITFPQGTFTITMAANPAVQSEINSMTDRLLAQT